MKLDYFSGRLQFLFLTVEDLVKAALTVAIFAAIFNKREREREREREKHRDILT